MRAVVLRVIAVAAVLLVTVPAAGFTSAAAAEPQPLAVELSVFPEGVTRLAGLSRYETAIAASERFAPGVPAAFVATGTDFPDALAGAAAAAALGGPLLLTPSNALPPAVRDEIRRLHPQIIYVLGGPAAVSPRVADALTAIAPTMRLGGADRYATARMIVEKGFASATHAIIATGRTFPDALGATGAASSRSAPVVLVDGARLELPSETLEMLERLGVEDLTIAGGPAAVSDGIRRQLESAGYPVVRHGGPTRYETNALLNAAYFSRESVTTAFLATGRDFPDALTGAALAGQLGAPLYVTQQDCTPPAIHDALSVLAATSLVVMGGTGVISAAAAANTPCVPDDSSVGPWSTIGWTLRTDVALPYADRPPVDVHSTLGRLDASGLWIYTRRDTGARADHPVAYAQYGISALLEYELTGDRIWLDRAVRQADRLIAMRSVRDDAWWFDYSFPWTYFSRTLTAPWWSGMAQGQALSLFVRLYVATGETRWAGAADHVWLSFTQPRSETKPWSTLVQDGRLYFEEYAGNQPPLLVLNGQIFALFGLYDYWLLTGHPEVGRYFDGGATTVLAVMPDIRKPGEVSYYCAQEDYCQTPGWQNPAYHVIHSWQLDTLARLTGDVSFTEWADLLRADWTPSLLEMRMAPLSPDAPPQ